MIVILKDIIVLNGYKQVNLFKSLIYQILVSGLKRDLIFTEINCAYDERYKEYEKIKTQ